MELTRPALGDEELALVKKCLESGWVTQGPFVGEFERLVALRQRVPFALATTSCTAALHLCMLALGIREGDEVIVPAFTWVTSAHCAEYVGATPVFADVDAATFNLDPEDVARRVSRRTRAIIAVHLFGLPADMDALGEIARSAGAVLVEDAACAIGAEWRGTPVGGIGDAGCFSFHPRKIVTTGEGGMVTTRREDVAEQVRILRNHGATGFRDRVPQPPPPWYMSSFDGLGFNLRLSDIQAAVGVAQMARLEGLLAERRAAAERYHELLDGLPDVARPIEPPGTVHTYQSYVVRVLRGGRARRNRAMEHMAEHGIQTRPGTHAVHRLGFYARRYRIDPDAFPVAAESEDTTITLPLFPGITAAQQEEVVERLREGLG